MSAVELVRAPTEAPLLLRAGEVARLTGVSRSKVYGMLAAEQLPGIVRLGGSVRVHRPTLEAWLEALARDGG